MRACVDAGSERSEKSERERDPSPGHSRVSRILSHSCIVLRQELPVAYWMRGERERDGDSSHVFKRR